MCAMINYLLDSFHMMNIHEEGDLKLSTGTEVYPVKTFKNSTECGLCVSV